MVRAFVAICIDENTRRRLVSVQTSLPTSGAKLKLVEPENLHLTLKFLGEVEDDKIREVGETLKTAVVENRSFEMKIKGLGVFPGFRYLRIIWAGVDQGKNEVMEIQKKIDSALQPLGFRLERDFHPHITIARVKFVRNREEIVSFVKENSSKEFGTVRVNEIDLMQSKLNPKGPIYSKIFEVKLKVTG